MNPSSTASYTAFAGRRQIASGDLRYVVRKAQNSNILCDQPPVLIFNDITGEVVDVDLRGAPEDLSHQSTGVENDAAPKTEPTLPDAGARGPGRPKLGVVAREVTLLPRHWEWLATQPGGASVALRKLVEQARRANQSRDRLRLAQEAAYRFLSAMAGNEPGFEEATRALFAGNRERFAKLVAPWPVDVRDHARKVAGRAFESLDAGHVPQTKPCYTLDELLATCDYSQPIPPEDREWVDAPTVGCELP